MFPRQKPISALGRQAGLGLPAAIFVIVVLALVVLALANLEERTGESLGQDVQSNHAFWAAESGAQAGLSVLFPPGGTPSNCGNAYFSGAHTIPSAAQGLAGCTFTVTCSAQTDTAGNSYFTLTSTGVCGGGVDRAQRMVEVGARDVVP